MKVAEFISSFLVKKEITDCFMITGGGAMQLDDALGHQKGLQCIFNHNEQGCAIAAEAYARLSGKIAAVCVTSGPGGTNAITGVLGGWLDSIPMLIISGQVKRETTLMSCPELELRQLGDQEFHIIDSISCMTKYSTMITKPEEIAYHLEKAYYLANHGRKGPVWLDIPIDVQGAQVNVDELIHFNPKDETNDRSVPHVEEEVIESVLLKIKHAKAPLLFVGEGIRLSDSAELLLRVVEKIQIPIAVAWNSGDLIAFDNKYYAGSPSREGTRSSSFIVQNCDLIIVLGSRMNIRTITYNHNDFAKNAYKIMIDIDNQELKKRTFIPDLPIHADVNEFLKKMLLSNYEVNLEHAKWLDWCKKMIEKYPAVLPEYHDQGENKLNPYVFVDILFSNMNSSDILTLGNGSACVMTFQACKIQQGQRMFTNSGCAAMGYGLPAALGAAVATKEKNKRIICIDGDGSIMMNLQELETISYNHLCVKIFILNNNGYHSIRQTQKNLFKSTLVGIDPKNGVGFPIWQKVAEAFEIQYEEINNECEANSKINKVLEYEGPVLCNVNVDPEQNFVPKLSSRITEDGTIVSPSMDDMFPFLDRDEYNLNRFL